MKKLNLLFGILIGLTILSCSSDSKEKNQEVNFFNNAYLEIHKIEGTTCYASLTLASGTIVVNPNEPNVINSDNENVVSFHLLKMNNCEIDNPSTRTFDIEKGISEEYSVSQPNVLYDIKWNNDGFESSNEYYADLFNITFVELTFTSSTSLNFKIHFKDGTILAESYSGKIIRYEN